MADQTPGDPGAHGGENAGGTKPFRVFATEDEFNAHAAGIRAAAERKVKAVLPDERAKLDALEAELAQHKQRDLEAQGNYEQAKAAIQKAAEDRIAKEQAAREKAIAALRKHLVDAQLRALAEAKGAYNPLDVVAHLKDCITLDEDFNVRVSDAPGGTVQDGVSLEQAVVTLLKNNPHLARATGSGSGSGASGGKSVSGAMSGSPAVREAQARYEEAVKRVAAHPQNAEAAAALMTAKAALKQAQAH
jgi:hypothetical protein